MINLGYAALGPNSVLLVVPSAGAAMAKRVRARRLSDQEGQRLQQVVRRGKHGSIRVRRAMIIMASASGTPVPAIAWLVADDGDTVRDVIHCSTRRGWPRWTLGGRAAVPRLISDGDIAVIVATATMRPEKLGLPFTHWSLRKLSAHLASGGIGIGRERLPQVLHARRISVQRTRTWKGVRRPGPGRQAGPDRAHHQRVPGPVLRF